MKKELKNFYFPQTVAYPGLAKNWKRLRSYRNRERKLIGDAVDVIEYIIPAPQPSAVGKRICFASDFHYSGTAADLCCSRECNRFLRELSPDFLLLGGDLCGDAATLGKLPELLENISGICPTAAVPGNWERRKTWLKKNYWHDLLKKYNITFLSNESHEDDVFFIYGSDDLRHGKPGHLPILPQNKTIILLAHQPDSAVFFDSRDELSGIDLIFSGHTHGGQIRFPLLGPLRLPSLYGTRFDYGLFRHRQKTCSLLVSSGMGHLSFPRRFNCKREIVLVRFGEVDGGIQP